RLLPSFFFFHDPSPTELYTLSLHDALPIFGSQRAVALPGRRRQRAASGLSCRLDDRRLDDQRAFGHQEREPLPIRGVEAAAHRRSEEHTSELQSRENLVCRLLLEKKKKPTE